MKKIPEWLNGNTKPTLRQLEKFANATFTPFGYLLLPEPLDDYLPIPYFRTLGDPTSRPSLNLIETVQIIKQRQDWMRDHLVSEGNDLLKFVNSVEPTDSPKKVVRSMKNVLNITDEWASGLKLWTDALRVLQDKMEEIGIYVATSGIVGYNTSRVLQVDEFRGFVLVDDYAPFVFVNGVDAKAAQMFTLAHELAHIWLGKSATFDLHNLKPADDVIEKACNQIAAEFLVSEEELRQTWSRFAGKSNPYRGTAQLFKVSEIVIARRALDLGLVNKSEFLDFYNKQYKSNTRTNGGNFYNLANIRIGRRFARTVINAVREEKILYREAYRLTGLKRSSFEEYARWLDKKRDAQPTSIIPTC